MNEEIKFKIIQDGFALFGQGSTPDEACEDAVEWIEDANSAEDVKNMLTRPADRFHGCLTMLYIGDVDFNQYVDSTN